MSDFDLCKETLGGKRIIFLGSSVTYGACAMVQSFIEALEEKDGIIAIKEAVSGTLLVDEDVADGKSYIARLATIDTNIKADAFVCQLSTNDASHNKPLGIISDSYAKENFDTKTIAGAIEFIIAYAKQTWHCPVIFYTGTKYDSDLYKKMVELLLSIQKKWQIDVIDLWNDIEMNQVSPENYKRYMSDPIHPLRDGYREWWLPKFEEGITLALTKKHTIDISSFVEKAKTLGVLGVKVTQHNELKAEWLSEGECRRNVYSATKSFTSCAMGFAVQEGLISLDEKLTDAFADDIPENPDENLKKATVRDLLTMCLGQESGHLMGEQRPLYKEDDWVKMVLSIPFVYEPGTHFVYNNVGPYLAGILVQRRSGTDLVSYLMPRLFKHLEIKRPTWEIDPLGNTFGAGGLFLTLSELHKFGLFYLNKGKWNGKQLLNAAWIEESTKPSDTEQYGYLFWRGKYNSYRADGKYSQLSIVLPDADAVVSLVAECRNGEELTQATNDLICAQL